ncbi:aldehyde dehydrogenase family protein [Conexibacter sp. JD483]|uniref:aldehyde dehydrogenase family protein n=1 Tax=unclassified Conexibacter TaxID=2627773 RepID=UPI002721C448|nr:MULTISPECIES: aldehyde dehydrogenase family protein [unclassified Conexibacter]MDO8184990.1 aldehyde dehydrogenase family protein [Conexibacter sp. CPCC 205706]MDO8198134.1 aldehyde dehydrogenase family protein [Conexibacter sp. CPCC 205762]MDR9368244.1 aldehyde dehydrogenase family protein [Conexibacter sp. JD483]
MSAQIATFRSADPRSGAPLEPAFADAQPAAVVAAADRAAAAFAAEWEARSFSDAALLCAIADGIEASAAALRERAQAETGLPAARLEGELARTVGQLRAFAAVAERGDLLDPIVDRADPGATPPKPDQRRANVPIGPVAVFAASNFPFAFSVAGGDTAAALAAGCPVVLKAHPAHPRTSELTAAVVAEAVAFAGAPAAWFQLLHGSGPAVGQALARADAIEAVAFTGSFAGGSALARAAAERARPIPVFAEMGSLNPLLVTPAAAAARGEQIADGLAAAVTGSAGQLCTKPGLIALVDDAAGRALAARLAQRLGEVEPAAMLTARLRDGFATAAALALGDERVETVVAAAADRRPGAWQAPLLGAVRARALEAGDALLEELFGPAALIAWCEDAAELAALPARLPAALTGSVHGERGEPLLATLVRRLAARVGRVVVDGYPTGVAVGWATVHGGPWPATSAAATTSVGMTAALRFMRPVGYQGLADELLPPALRDANPLGLVRRLDGRLTDAAVERR